MFGQAVDMAQTETECDILPGTGRGTIRRMVEGHRQVIPTSLASTLWITGLCPSTTSWSPSPCRGGLA